MSESVVSALVLLADLALYVALFAVLRVVW